VRAILSRLLLAVAVVLFQHGAVAHVLMHASEEAGHRHDGDRHAPHGCEACHAYAAAEGGEPPPALVAHPAGATLPRAACVHPAAPRVAPAKPFHSQAPPSAS
jgi:hypothetical protein